MLTGRTPRENRDSRMVVRGAQFAPDGRTYVRTGADSNVSIWNAQTGERFLAIPFPEKTSGVAISPDGDLMAVGIVSSNQAALVEVATGQVVRWLTGHSNSVLSVDFSPGRLGLHVARRLALHRTSQAPESSLAAHCSGGHQLVTGR